MATYSCLNQIVKNSKYGKYVHTVSHCGSSVKLFKNGKDSLVYYFTRKFVI